MTRIPLLTPCNCTLTKFFFLDRNLCEKMPADLVTVLPGRKQLAAEDSNFQVSGRGNRRFVD